MDPFRDEETSEQRLHNLETLWFNVNEQEWIMVAGNHGLKIKSECPSA